LAKPDDNPSSATTLCCPAQQVREEAAGRHQFAKSNASAASAALKSLSGMVLGPGPPGGDVAAATASSLSNDVQLAARGDAAAALRMDALTVAFSAQVRVRTAPL